MHNSQGTTWPIKHSRQKRLCNLRLISSVITGLKQTINSAQRFPHGCIAEVTLFD